MSNQPGLPACKPGTSGENPAECGTTIEKDTLSRLVEKQLEEIDQISEKIELWTRYRDDYKQLDRLIDRMQDNVRYPHRIPVAGDNYFALRSARQSSKIIARRLEQIEENLRQSKEAKRKTEDWMKATEEHRREREEFVEIIETM